MAAAGELWASVLGAAGPSEEAGNGGLGGSGRGPASCRPAPSRASVTPVGCGPGRGRAWRVRGLSVPPLFPHHCERPSNKAVAGGARPGVSVGRCTGSPERSINVIFCHESSGGGRELAAERCLSCRRPVLLPRYSVWWPPPCPSGWL